MKIDKKLKVLVAVVSGLLLITIVAIQLDRADGPDTNQSSPPITEGVSNGNARLVESSYVDNSTPSLDNEGIDKLRDSEDKNGIYDSKAGNVTANARPDFSEFVKSDTFLQHADNLIFQSAGAISNPETKNFIQRSFDQFVTQQKMSNTLNIEYNECNMRSCILSIEAHKSQITDETFEIVKREVLFGTMSQVTESGGKFFIVDNDGTKSIRVLYDLET